MSIGLSVNKEKNGMLLAFLASAIPNVHLRKLLKIVYLIDEHFMKLRGYPLTWFEYFVWEKGPVAPEVYAIRDGAFSDFVLSLKIGDKRVVRPAKKPSEIDDGIKRMFSEREAYEVRQLTRLYMYKTADQLSDLTHVANSIWSNAVKNFNVSFSENGGKSSYRIDFAALFDADDWRIREYHGKQKDMAIAEMLETEQKDDASLRFHMMSPSEREIYHTPVYTPLIP